MCFLETAVQCKLSEDEVQVTLSLIVHPLRLATRKHALDAAHHICVY